MKDIIILALDDAAATTVVSPIDVFNLPLMCKNVCWETPFPALSVQIATPTGAPVKCANNIFMVPHMAIADVRKTDLVIISSILDIEKTLREQGEVIPWLQQQYEQGVELAALCSGVFILGETGLLDHREATTHWAIKEQFRRRFPDVILKPERLVTDSGGLYCSGAFSSCIDLSIYLLEKFYGHAVAVQCGKSLAIDIGRSSQVPYTSFDFQRNHNDKEISASQFTLEKECSKKINFDKLAESVGLARRTFERRFKAATGDTPNLYLQRVRVERAKKMLEEEEMTFEEISYQLGYEDIGFFRKTFIKHTGLRPKQYKTKFQRVCRETRMKRVLT